jgi:hypothetical protein
MAWVAPIFKIRELLELPRLDRLMEELHTGSIGWGQRGHI